MTDSLSLTVPSSFVPFSSCNTSGTGGGAMLGACRHEPSNDRNHCGRRKQNSTADATIRDMPRYAMEPDEVRAEGGRESNIGGIPGLLTWSHLVKARPGRERAIAKCPAIKVPARPARDRDTACMQLAAAAGRRSGCNHSGHCTCRNDARSHWGRRGVSSAAAGQVRLTHE